MKGYSKGIVMGLTESADANEHIIVWAPKFPLKELHFLHSDNEFEPGDFVHFQLTATIGQGRVQRTKLFPADSPPNIEIVGRSLMGFQVQVQISIPPRDCNYFDELTFATLDFGVIFYCYNPAFGKIVSFIPLEELGASYGKSYTARIERVSKNVDWLIEQMGTMFSLADGHKLIEIDDPGEIQRPWNRSTSSEQPIIQNNGPIQIPSEVSNDSTKIGHPLPNPLQNHNLIPNQQIGGSNVFVVLQQKQSTNSNLLHPGHGINSIPSTKTINGNENQGNIVVQPKRELNDFGDYVDYSPLQNIPSKAEETTINQSVGIIKEDELSKVFNHQQQSSGGIKESPSMPMPGDFDLSELASMVKSTLSKLKESNASEALDMQKDYFTMCNAMRRDLLLNGVDGLMGESIKK